MVKKLSSFQIEKLTFFFKAFFDVNRDGIVNVSFKKISFIFQESKEINILFELLKIPSYLKITVQDSLF